MNILSIDTTSQQMSIVLSKGGVIFSQAKSISVKNYESVTSLIAALIKKARLSLGCIDLFSACIGPGSFTGIRIGLSTIKALSYALHVPVVGLRSLDVDAWMVKDSFSGLLCVMRDARRNNIYATVYSIDRSLRRVDRYCLTTFTDFVEKIVRARRIHRRGAAKTKHALYFYGDAVAAKKDAIQKFFPHSILLPQKNHYHKARAMISLTMNGLKRTSNSFNLLPLYMYPRDCQVQRQ